MGSNRFILALLGIIFLVIVVMSSSRLIDAIRKKTGLQKSQISDAQISMTPTPIEAQIEENKAVEVAQNNKQFKGSEIPSTGPNEVLYIVLGGGIAFGTLIKRFKG